MRRAAVIVAAGRGVRMGEDKVWLSLGSLPVVAYPVRTFASCLPIPRLVLVVSRWNMERARGLLAGLGVAGIVCEGGERRQDSVRRGLSAVGDAELVAIHDGARPLVSVRLIEACYRAAERDGAGVAAVPIRDTIKSATAEGWVSETVPRTGLWAAQTPQAFRTDLIRRAYDGLDREVTDDAAAVELLGHPIRVVPGDPINFKLTTRADLVIARVLVARLASGEEL